MKKGDEVRFIHSIGGGVIAGFKDKNTVLVEDEDGFQIPTPINEVVIVNAASDDLIVSVSDGEDKYMAHSSAQPAATPAPSTAGTSAPSLRREFSGGNRLTAHIAFIAMEPTRLGHTIYEAYLVNDSNYHLFAVLSTAVGGDWQLRFSGELKPNSKQLLQQLDMNDAQQWERISVQLIACKHDRPYELKPSVDVQMRLDQVKLCKAGCFRSNDYFEDPAFLLTIIDKDKSARPLVVQSDAMKREMYRDEIPQFTQTHKRPEQLRDPNAPIVVDLHAEALLDDMRGMSNAEILDYQLDQFRKVMNEHRRNTGRKIVFIHGKGEGTLRRAIIQELQYRYKPCRWQDASFREYGYGATQITIK